MFAMGKHQSPDIALKGGAWGVSPIFIYNGAAPFN
jgi:hypothetical protein